MGIWVGPYFKGAMRAHREEKRDEAERRNAAYHKRGCVPADPRYRTPTENARTEPPVSVGTETPGKARQGGRGAKARRRNRRAADAAQQGLTQNIFGEALD